MSNVKTGEDETSEWFVCSPLFSGNLDHAPVYDGRLMGSPPQRLPYLPPLSLQAVPALLGIPCQRHVPSLCSLNERVT